MNFQFTYVRFFSLKGSVAIVFLTISFLPIFFLSGLDEGHLKCNLGGFISLPKGKLIKLFHVTKGRVGQNILFWPIKSYSALYRQAKTVLTCIFICISDQSIISKKQNFLILLFKGHLMSTVCNMPNRYNP